MKLFAFMMIVAVCTFFVFLVIFNQLQESRPAKLAPIQSIPTKPAPQYQEYSDGKG